MNPFSIPGEANPVAPLKPWRHPEHDDYYVPIDHTHEAFSQFQDEMGDLCSLLVHGRLVVVSGQEGCGKTALVNRCAKWLRDGLASVGVYVLIFDLTLECRLEHAVDERMSHICRRLTDELKIRQVLTEPQLKDLTGYQGKPDAVYPYLSSVLEPSVSIAVLLPPTELVNELVRYASLVRPKIVFFAERSSVDGIAAHRAEITRLLSMPPVELDVGPLRPEDAWRFASDRLARNSLDKSRFPGLIEQDMHRVTSGGTLSIRWLQRILHGVFKERLNRIAAETEPSYNDITYADITDYVFREIVDRRRGSGR